MKEIFCFILGHKEEAHLDYVYGVLPREHRICTRCNKTTHFERITEEQAGLLPLVDCF